MVDKVPFVYTNILAFYVNSASILGNDRGQGMELFEPGHFILVKLKFLVGLINHIAVFGHESHFFLI